MNWGHLRMWEVEEHQRKCTLVINTSVTIVTLLMVLPIRRTRNTDSLAIHLKLNELLSAMAVRAIG